MNNVLLKSLDEKNILLSDGALGTMLQKKGLAIGECPESWNDTNAQKVIDIAKEYFNAGSDMVLTNTFGGSIFKLKKFGLEKNADKYNALGVEHVLKAGGGKGFAVASVGPSGEFLAPLGDIEESDMIKAYAKQVISLYKSGVHAILAETMSSIEETLCIIKATKENCDLPVMATMTFSLGNNDYNTMMGVSVAQAAEELQRAGADVIGANCGNGMTQMIEIVKIMKPCASVPILVHANAGMPELVNGETVFKETPEEMASKIADLINAGARIIGGCCGTTPAHINAFRKKIDSILNNK